jgi:hypothetical protein
MHCSMQTLRKNVMSIVLLLNLAFVQLTSATVLPSITSRAALWAGIGEVMPRLEDDGFTGVLTLPGNK